MLFKMYLSVILTILQRQLAESEIKTAQEFFQAGYSANYTAEYLK